ncbi:hypothetical protein SAMN05421831_11541 [Allopseudospirillum japonicum]|uniref:FlxA-like protein n=1 Tax=Allopseudospirillum japonicum TaxID=64971 RepID=A0A1H6U892_9GAMM|nr:hypothetical protein [Allopseudospirillum japonicum]SEI88583.1 hypothetical protein SAMN05421831_11541 [Allopseudospirillum japonicum]
MLTSGISTEHSVTGSALYQNKQEAPSASQRFSEIMQEARTRLSGGVSASHKNAALGGTQQERLEALYAKLEALESRLQGVMNSKSTPKDKEAQIQALTQEINAVKSEIQAVEAAMAQAGLTPTSG